MALNSFLSINLPYGLIRNDKGEWATFNREYMQLGMGKTDSFKSYNSAHFKEQHLYVKYTDLTEDLLAYLGSSYDVKKDEKGNICELRLFHPENHPLSDPKIWNDYFDKLKFLARLKVDKS